MDHSHLRTSADSGKVDEERQDLPFGAAPPTHYEKATQSAEEARFERSTVRKVDIRLLIILGALYSIAIIDRTNISTARVAGMAKELKLTVGERYSIITTVFFVPYILFEIPSNILLRKIGARNVICTIAALWGAATIGQGFVDTWTQLVGMRVLVGFFEAGFFPGCVFLIQTWYTRYETQKRLAVFYLTSTVIAGFSSILGYGLAQLNGRHGLTGWRWIFIIEGVMTIGLALLGAFLIVDFPDKNKFLTREQTQLMIDRVNADRGDALPDKLTLEKTCKYLCDWKLWCFGLCFMSSTMPAYAFSYFLPVILQGGGYSEIQSLCLPAPPYVAGAIWTFAMAWAADRYHRRGPFIIISCLVTIVGLMIMGYTDAIGVRYFGSFLVICGAQANIPATLAYSANNITSHSKRNISSAIVIGFGGIGGIFASTVYRQADFPRYLPGLWATFGCQILTIAIVTLFTFYFGAQNRAADEGRRGDIEGTPRFRYTL